MKRDTDAKSRSIQQLHFSLRAHITLTSLWILKNPLQVQTASLVAQLVKSLPAIRETGVRFLGQEDSLEKEMATHSSILAREIPQTEEPGTLQSMGLQKRGM